MPDALISRITSRGPGVGSGKSLSSSFRSPRKTTPFMVASGRVVFGGGRASRQSIFSAARTSAATASAERECLADGRRQLAYCAARHRRQTYPEPVDIVHASDTIAPSGAAVKRATEVRYRPGGPDR